MDDKKRDVADDSSLHEYIDAEISLDPLATPPQEKILHISLERLPGVKNVTIVDGKVAVRYEPVQVTKRELVQAIQSAGFHTTEVESGSASSLTDAFATTPGTETGDETSPTNKT